MREKPIPPSLLKSREGHWGKGISTDKDDLPDFELIVKAINLIENPNLPRGEWKRIVMAIWAAFLGNADELAAAHAFSSKSDKYDAEGTDRAWAEVTGSPPSDLSAGTLIYMADQAAPGWRAEAPSFRTGTDLEYRFDNWIIPNCPDGTADATSMRPWMPKHREQPEPEPEPDADADHEIGKQLSHPDPEAQAKEPLTSDWPVLGEARISRPRREDRPHHSSHTPRAIRSQS